MINGSSGDDILKGNSQDNTIYGFEGNDIILPGAGNNYIDGGAGIDTVSYGYRTAGVTVDLNQNIAIRKFTTTEERQFKILPLGSSNTSGFPNTPDNGGYRTRLWTSLVKNENYNIDFVGPAANGPSDIDRNHSGFGGFKIDDLINNVELKGELDSSGMPIYKNIETVLTDHAPDMVLLMAGNNDLFAGKTVDQTLNDLGILVDLIIQKSPNTRVLVASLTPNKLNPELQAKVTEYSNRIESEVVNPRIVRGDRVSFVDMFNAPLNDSDYLSDGIHLTQSGYDKLATIWRQAILNTQDGQDILVNLENIHGSMYDDLLIGNTGDNFINGSYGNDTLIGGFGNNLLTGGVGRDLFVLAPGPGIDTITDFTIGQDSIGLSGGLTYEQLSIVQGIDLNANDSFITVTDSAEVLAVLLGVPAAAIASPANFTPV